MAPAPSYSALTILIAGASRGLGHAMTVAFLERGWTVIATVRTGAEGMLHDLAGRHPARLEIETLDIDVPDEITGLRRRLSGRPLDILFVNAGTTTRDEHVGVGDVTTEEFARVMLTNALSPMRVIEGLQDLVSETGLIGVMSSGQGSIANNEKGMRDVYRSSKAALNMFMRSFAARQAAPARTMLLLAPGWVRTELGGPDAPFGIDEVMPDLVGVLVSNFGTPGLRYLDRHGHTVPW